MKTLKLLVLFLLLSVYGNCQQDSVSLVKANWKVVEILPGVSWKSFHFTDSLLFNARLNINLIEILPQPKSYELKIVSSDSLEKTSSLLNRYGALAAINGSFFRMKAEDSDSSNPLQNRSVDYLRINGKKVVDNFYEKGNTRRQHQLGTVVINNNVLTVQKARLDVADWEHSLEGNDIITSGPMLLSNGNKEPVANNAFNKNRHPRTAIGCKDDGTIMMFVVDGRTSWSYGLSIEELQNCLAWLDCKNAINLDGGGSSTMVVAGQPFSGVVNCPCDNNKFDHEGERNVANAILIVKK